jgi:hypothetical protein
MDKSISSLSQSLTGNLQAHLTSQDDAEVRELKAIVESVPEKVELYDSAFSYIMWFALLAITLPVAIGLLLGGERTSGLVVLACSAGPLLLAWGRFRSSRTHFATLTRTHLRVRNAESDLPLTAIDHFEVYSQTITWLFPSTFLVTMSLFLKENREAPKIIKSYNTMHSCAGWNAKKRMVAITSGGIKVKGQRGGTDGFIDLFARYLDAAAAAEELAKRQRQD